MTVWGSGGMPGIFIRELNSLGVLSVLDWMASVIFVFVLIGLIFLAMRASESNNMTMCWVWLRVTSIAIIARLAV